MVILFRKKKVLFLISVLGIVVTCMLAPFTQGNGGEVYSVFDAVRKLPASELGMFSVQSAFSSGSSSFWFYLLMPVAAAIPVASYISDEWKSGFHLYERMRGGTFAYVCIRFFYMVVSNATVLFAGLGIYMLVVLAVLSVVYLSVWKKGRK